MMTTAMMLSSCSEKNGEPIEGENMYSIIVIDSCEYLMKNKEYSGAYSFTHKGNCKFCKEREKTK